MWSTESYWFDIALVTSLFAVGSVLFGHFEEHRPKWRRLLKLAVLVALVVSLSAAQLRWVAWTVIGLLLVGGAVVHLWWLPRNGINGWTGEPRDKYLALVGGNRRRR